MSAGSRISGASPYNTLFDMVNTMSRPRLTQSQHLQKETLLVRRVNPHGRARSWTFQPFWVRVTIDETAGLDSHLVLSSHGHHVALGDFLLHEERVALAKELRGALAPLKGSA